MTDEQIIEQLKIENEKLKADLKSLEYTIVLQSNRDIDNAIDLFAKRIAKIENENSILKAENEELKQKLHQCWTVENSFVEQIDQLEAENKKLKRALTEIKEIAEPYKMTIKKICGNCKKYDSCNACCYKDINCYKYTSSTSACEEFTYLDKLIPNILANKILQKISECEVENAK